MRVWLRKHSVSLGIFLSTDSFSMHPPSPALATSTPPARFINVISTKRSGHHAFISWIQTGSSGPTRFINNAAISPGLIASVTELSRCTPDSPAIIMNYEGVSIPGVDKVTKAQAATGAAVQNVLFVRDPLNACASLLHRKSFRQLELVMILRQLFALKNWLKQYQDRQFDGELAFYNRWLVDPHYRERLADRLSINAAQLPNEITSHGGGSSFQDLSRGGESAAPRLLQRWKAYADDRLFRALVAHPCFSDIFMDELSGAIRDERGYSDEDAERVAFLETACRQRRRLSLVDRVIEGLMGDQEAFERIEALPAGLQKRLLILKAHIGALVLRPHQPRAGAVS